VEEHCAVLISGTLTEFAVNLPRKTKKQLIITTILDETQTGHLPNASQKLYCWKQSARCCCNY